MDDVEREVRRIVSQVLKVPEARLQPGTDLRTDLNVDSLLGLQIVAVLEQRFRLTVPDEDLDLYTTVGSIADTVRRLQAGQVAG